MSGLMIASVFQDTMRKKNRHTDKRR